LYYYVWRTVFDMHTKVNFSVYYHTVSMFISNLESTGGPRYMRSFYLRIRVNAIEKWPFFLEPILQFTVIVGLFICEFIIC